MPQDVEISLREVTAETVRAICKLDVRPAQRGYVAPNSFSIAQAYFEPRAWFRAVYANETPVGFVMLELDRERQSYFLWRFMIGAAHQGRGYGRRALTSLWSTSEPFPEHENCARVTSPATEVLAASICATGLWRPRRGMDARWSFGSISRTALRTKAYE